MVYSVLYYLYYICTVRDQVKFREDTEYIEFGVSRISAGQLAERSGVRQ